MSESAVRTDVESRREVGLFRYALVRDAADPGLSKRERGGGGWSGSRAARLISGSARIAAAGSKRSFRNLGLFCCARRPGCSSWRSS